MKFRKILLFILLISLLSSCSSFLSPSEESSIDQSGEMSEGMVPSYTNEEQDISKDVTNISSDEKLIQTIGLEIETKQYTTTISDIEALVKSLGGYIQSSYIPRPKAEVEFSNLQANLVVMIPTKSIEDFILEAGKSSNIVSESREAYNVTDSYRDTKARITTLKAKELRLLELLNQSGSLSDLLMIENELSNTRYEIERLESTILDYDKRIEYTQFNLSVREVYEYSPSDEASLWEKIVEGFSSNAQNFLRSLETGFVFIVTTLPFILIQFILWCLPVAFIYFIFKKFSKNKSFNLFKKFIKKDNPEKKE